MLCQMVMINAVKKKKAGRRIQNAGEGGIAILNVVAWEDLTLK